MLWFDCSYSESGGGTQGNTMYNGRDLTKIFALEIANFSSPWHWIQNRINNRNYKGINNGDFIPMTLTTGEAHEMQIAGINTYKRTTDQNLDDHIDFISRDCYSETVQWNTTNNNNGTAASWEPYLVSNVYRFLNEELYNKLPTDIKNVISPKRLLLESRYSASGILTESTNWNWQNLGKLWLPNEYEVFGSIVWGTKGYSAGQAVQYLIFANSWKNRIKGAGPGGGRCHWWLLSVTSGDSTTVCGVDGNGAALGWNASNAIRVPICFRINRKIS